MIVLDTNVVSEPWRPQPDPGVLTWLRAHPDVLITAVSVAELRYGAQCLPHGKRRERLISRVAAMVESSRSRILAFDEAAASAYAEVRESRRRAGRPISVEDAMIAAITQVAAVPLATRNTADFDGLGLDLVDPWAG